MISIEERLKKLNLIDEAIANEDDSWGNTPEDWEMHLEILIAGGAVVEKYDDSYTCEYIKIDGSICGKGCTRIEGCKNHWNSKNKRSGTPCKICGEFTRIRFGYCRNHAGKHYKKKISSSKSA